MISGNYRYILPFKSEERPGTGARARTVTRTWKSLAVGDDAEGAMEFPFDFEFM